MITSARKPPVTKSAPAVLNKGRLLLAVASILGAAAVYADPSPQGTPDSTTDTRDEEASGREGSIIGTVTVTGSRIARPNVESASPVTVIDEAFDHVADSNIIREFHKIPQIQPARGPTQGGGFSGSFVDLRGMGWNRTLVLVNGRRYISTLSGGGVDVSTLPPELIQRAELMTGGGSATYGSDAIAGVLNFILRDDIEGVELHAQTGSTTRGEDSTRHFGLIGGSKFADGLGYGYISLAYDESKLILPGNRDYANVVFNNVNGALVPVTSTYVGTGVANAPPFGGPAIFNSSGEMFTAPGVINPLTDGDRFNTGVRTNLQQPQELRTLHTGLRYALSDSVELYTEASFIDSETVRSLVSNAVDIVFPVNIDNPFLGPITQAWLADQDTDGDGLVAIPGLRRRFNEVDVGGAITPRTSYRVLVGSRVALAGSWSLDAYFLTQRSRFNWEANGAVGFDQLEQALLATTDAEGNIVCIDDRFDCVPVDVFSPNGITPEAAAFLHVTPKVKSVNEDTIASATVNGTVMDLPAGPLQVAFGAEYLRFSAEETPDHILSTGRSSAEGFGFVRGVNESNEAFFEADVPLLNERPWAHHLGLQVGARYSDYDISDGAWTYKGMLQWAPVDGFKLRAGVQHAIRQAAVFERFSGDAFLDLLLVDPCFTGAPLTGDLRNACIASGMPAALADSGVTVNPDGYIFLNKDIASPDLAPEEADSYTFGFVMDSLGVDDLVVSLDYYDIQVDGGISTFGRDLIFRQCYTLASADNNSFCGLITRDAVTGEIDELNNVRVNTAEVRRTGIDFAASYPFHIGQGTLRANVNANYKFESSLVPTAIAPEDKLECSGYYSPFCGVVPRLQMLNSLSWHGGPMTASLAWQYIGTAKDILVKDNPARAATLARTSVPSVNYFDLYTAWQFGNRVEVFGGVNNLLDKEPPVVGNDRASFANSYPAQYDLIGRRYYLGMRVTF